MIDITRLAPVELDRFIHMQALVDRQAANHTRVRALRDYYDGDHPVLLTRRQQEFLGDLVTDGGFAFAHNLLKAIIDTLAERLNVIGFTVNGVTADDAQEDAPSGEVDTARWLWGVWDDNRMDAHEDDAHIWALRDGLAYVIVDYDAEQGRPRLNLHKADDGKTGVTLHRDPTDTNRILFANRYWYTYDPLNPGATGKERKTTYLPGEIRKYVRQGDGAWAQTTDAEDGDLWPLPWKDAAGTPLGVPVFEFANPGGSEIGQIIGLQNALNKSWLDLIAAADAAGFPLLAVEYSNGGALPAGADDDDLEGADELRIAPGRAIEVDNAKIHRLEAANLTSMIDTIWAFVTAIAGVSRTPQYYFRQAVASDALSGEALKTLESGLVKRAQQRQVRFGQTWADALAMAYRVERAFGAATLPQLDKVRVETQWADPNVRNELVQAQTAQLHQGLNVPDEQVWTLLGYSPDQIAKFKEGRRRERAAEVASIADALRVQQTRQAPQTNPQGFGQNGG